MPWKPSEPGEVPTLGYYVIDWMTEFLARPAIGHYEPFVPYLEQEDFILRWYELNPVTGRFLRNRGLLGRSRGWGKSPILAGLSLVEGLADVVFDGWDADGQPVGRPWSTQRTPLIHVAAVSEAQTKNSWQPLLEFIDGPLVDEYPGLEPMDTMVNLPVGKIEKITSSSRTVKGAPSIFAILDQTEEWVPGNGGPDLADKIRTNCAKNGGRTLESPNAFTPGQSSVAEASEKFAKLIREGRSKTKGLLYDHREAPPETDLEDRESLTLGLRIAYGDSSGHPDGCLLHDPPCAPGHVDLEAQIEMIWDPDKDEQVSRQDYLNQITEASDAYVGRNDWNSRGQASVKRQTHVEVPDLKDGEAITLGFDGSRKRRKGKTDATALIACRLSDGLIVPIDIWEEPEKVEDIDWKIPADEVDLAVRNAFKKYRVIGFYADPAKWEGYVANWEADFGPRLKVKATRANPIHWWMVGGRRTLVTKALDAFIDAVLDGELVHADHPRLTNHMLNARVRTNTGGYGIFKEYPDSPNKIDAAVAAVLAWQARLDAVAAGHAKPQRKRSKPRRLY